MQLHDCPDFGQAHDPKSAVAQTVFLTRLGSPEGGRLIFLRPWLEKRALPECAAGLVPDALAEAQAPCGAPSVPGARSDLMSDLWSDLMSDFVSDFVSGICFFRVRFRGPILDPIFSCCGAQRSGRNKIGREIGRKIGRKIGPHLGHPRSIALNAPPGHCLGHQRRDSNRAPIQEPQPPTHWTEIRPATWPWESQKKSDRKSVLVARACEPPRHPERHGRMLWLGF